MAKISIRSGLALIGVCGGAALCGPNAVPARIAIGGSAPAGHGMGLGVAVTEPDTDRVGEFYDPIRGCHWSCGTDTSPGLRGNINSGNPWTVTSTCFPDAPMVVPFRVTVEGWFGSTPDPYVLPEDENDPNDPPFPGFPIEDMAVEDVYFPLIFEAMEEIEAACNIQFVQWNPNVCPDLDGVPVLLIVQAIEDDPFYMPDFEGNTSSSLGPGGGPIIEWTYYGEDDEEGDPPSGDTLTSVYWNVVNVEDWSLPVVIHELMHAIGFAHEHQRADRDTFIQVFYENIDTEDLSQFTPGGGGADFGPYDFESIMHYGPFAFTNNGQRTIRVRQPYAAYYGDLIGSGFTLSEGDAQGLRYMYGTPNCPSDLNGDFKVDIQDFHIFIQYLIQNDPRGDINNDGLTNVGDFLEFMEAYAGRVCFVPPPKPIIGPPQIGGGFDPF